MAQSEAARRLAAKYQNQRRRQWRVVLIVVLSITVPLMSLATWYVSRNYRLVYEPQSGRLRWLTVAEVEAMRTAKPVTAPAAPRVKYVEVREPMEPTIAAVEPEVDAAPGGEAGSKSVKPAPRVTSFFGVEVHETDAKTAAK